MPENAERRPPKGAAPTNQPRSAHHYIAACRRRRDASYRVEPLDCGCRDPWTCRCHDSQPSERMTDAAADAAEYLLHHGLPPIFSIDQGRALWRAGRRDLAVMCAQQVVA